MAAVEAMAAETLERLEALSCPAVLGGPPRAPPAALELLCRPSPTRWALLCWAGARVYPPLSAELESLNEEDQIRALAALGAELLLCGPEDLALIQGSAPPEQQLQFLQDLLDAACGPEADPKTSPPVLPLLLELLETPEGRGALSPPRGPSRPPRTPPGPRRPLPKLEQELGGVRRGLEELQEQLSNLGGSSTPDPPNLGVLGGALTSLAAEFGASELRGPPGPPKNPQIWGGGRRVPPVGRGLQQLGQVLGTLAQLGNSAGEVTRLGGVTEAIGPQIPPLARRFQPPPDRTIPGPQIPPPRTAPFPVPKSPPGPHHSRTPNPPSPGPHHSRTPIPTPRTAPFPVPKSPPDRTIPGPQIPPPGPHHSRTPNPPLGPHHSQCVQSRRQRV